MKRLTLFFRINPLSRLKPLLLLLLVCGRCDPEEVAQYAPTESYPEEESLWSIQTDKRAMVVTAHDDDMCAMSGTLSRLNKEGWEIISVCFRHTNPDRNAAHVRTSKHVIDSVSFIELTGPEYRDDLHDSVVAYEAIPKSVFPEVFNYNEVERELVRIIDSFDPTVIFTLDNEIGGYGHPEHVFMSQLVLDLSAEQKIGPQYIYQSVYTDHMENTILGERHKRRMESWGFDGNGWERAKSTYGVSGMPEPTTQVHITSEASEKMAYLSSYNERERKTIGFFIPAFEQYEAEEYFKVFDREFFRVIDVTALSDSKKP